MHLIVNANRSNLITTIPPRSDLFNKTYLIEIKENQYEVQSIKLPAIYDANGD